MNFRRHSRRQFSPFRRCEGAGKGAFSSWRIPENSNSLAGSSRKRRLFGVLKGAFLTKPDRGAGVAAFFRTTDVRVGAPSPACGRGTGCGGRGLWDALSSPHDHPHPRPVDRTRSTPPKERGGASASPPSHPNEVQRAVSCARAANGLAPPERAKPDCQRAAASFEATIRKRQSRRASAAARSQGVWG
jgi:hypothetical protein